VVEEKKPTLQPREKKLTRQQKIFANQFAFNGQQRINAAIAAGVSRKVAKETAWKWLQIPKVREAIKETIDKEIAPLRRKPSWVLERLENLVEDCGDPESERYSAKDAIRALELLGKYHKLFTEKVEIEVRVDLGDQLRDARLRRRLSIRAAQKEIETAKVINPDGSEVMDRQKPDYMSII